VERSKQFITRVPDRLAVELTLAWSFLAEGKGDAALRTVDAVEREALAKKNDFGHAWAAFERAEMLEEQGRGVEALKQLAQARARGEKGRLSGAEQNRLRRAGLVLQARIGARGSSPQDAEQALAGLEEELKAAPSNADLRGMVRYAQGLAALSHGDLKAAAASFARCPDTDYRCKLDLVQAQAKAGETAASEESRARIMRANVRDDVHRGEDPAYLYVWARLKAGGPLAGR
jgi:ATP/maltotriose-dependent transcriptional regulator MalT